MLFGLIKALISLTGGFGIRSAGTHSFNHYMCIDLGTCPTCPFAATCRARSYQDAFEVPQEGDKRPVTEFARCACHCQQGDLT